MSHHDTILNTVDATVLTPLVRAALGRNDFEVTDWSHKAFGHSLDEVHGTDRSVFRFTGTAQSDRGDTPWTLVLKIITTPAAPTDPASPSNGAREALAYQSGLFEGLTGLRAPRCVGSVEQPWGDYWLWLEEVVEGIGRHWPRERYLLAARHLGQFKASHREGETQAYPWLSRSPLREGFQEFSAAFDLLGAARRDNPFVAQAVSDDAAAALEALPDKTLQWLERLDTLPQAICHWDAHRANLLSTTSRDGAVETVAIDWAGVGWGPMGVELSKFLSATVNFYGQDAASLPDLDAHMFDHYVSGLREAGWEGDPNLVRFGHTAASAVRLIVRTASALKLATNERARQGFERAAGVPFASLVNKFAITLPYYVSLTDEAERLANAG